MPFKSKRQMRKFFAMEERGELPEGTAERWAHETPSIKKLPEKKGPSSKRKKAGQLTTEASCGKCSKRKPSSRRKKAEDLSVEQRKELIKDAIYNILTFLWIR